MLDHVSRLTADAFESNRRLSETNLLDLKPHKGHCRASSPHLFVEQNSEATAEADTNLENPFQNDKLPLWQQDRKSERSEAYSNASSPDNNNYGGQQLAYRYKSLNETPTSPDLANHRDLMTNAKHDHTTSTPTSPEIIQVCTGQSYQIVSPEVAKKFFKMPK